MAQFQCECIATSSDLMGTVLISVAVSRVAIFLHEDPDLIKYENKKNSKRVEWRWRG